MRWQGIAVVVLCAAWLGAQTQEAVAQVGEVFLRGQYVEVGIHSAASFGTAGSSPAGFHPIGRTQLGFVADIQKDGWSAGTPAQSGDYFLPGTPEEGWGLQWTGGGAQHNFNNFGRMGLSGVVPTRLVETSSGDMRSAVWEGDAVSGSERIHVVQTVSFKSTDLFFVMNVVLTNTGTAGLSAVKYLRNVDPDNEADLAGRYDTYNYVTYQPGVGGNTGRALVVAKGPTYYSSSYPVTLGLGTIDSRAKVSTEGFSNRWPDEILNSPNAPSPASPQLADQAIALAYDLGSLAPGQSVSVDYAYILAESDLSLALGSLAAITILQPTGTVSGATVVFQATTDDVEDTTQVEFFVNGTVVGVDSTADAGGVFESTFDSRALANGTLSLTVRATFEEGRVVEKTATATVDNSGPPIAFATPTAGQGFSGSGIRVSIEVLDSGQPPVRVSFFRETTNAGSQFLAQVLSAPFATTFSVTDLPVGETVVLKAVAVDDAGHTTTIQISGSVASNAAPTAGSYSLSTAQGQSATTAATALLASASDPDGDTLTLVSVESPSAHGGLARLSDGNVLYQPPAGFAGSDSFAFTVSDGHGGTASGIVHVTVFPLLSIADATAGEVDPGVLAFRATLAAPFDVPVTVAYTTAGESAWAGSDFASASGVLTFAPGNISQAITVSILDDAIDEDDETLVLRLSGAVNAVVTRATATGTIVDDDEPPTLSIADATSAEDGGRLTFTLTLSRASGRAVTAGFATVDGSARAGHDYTSASGTLSFAPGVVSRSVTVVLLADATDENDETFTLALSSPTHVVLEHELATATILDDDAPPSASVADTSVVEGDATGSTLSFPISLSAPSGLTVVVDYASENGTAVAGSDYLPALGSLTFQPGVVALSAPVTLFGDLLNEADETVRLAITARTSATLGRGVAVGTIVNDDPLPRLSVDDVALSEGNSGSADALFTVSLSAPAGRSVSVRYATADATATAPSDYLATSGELAFAEGVTSRTVAVRVLGDTLIEHDESFWLLLSSPVNALLGDRQGVATIRDRDCGFWLSPSEASIDAGGGRASVVVIAGADCRWTAVVPRDVTLLGSASGIGPGTLTYYVAPNTATRPRVLTMTLEGRTLALRQGPATLSRPQPPVLVAPSRVVKNPKPTYTWERVAGASRYDLGVVGPQGTVVAAAYGAWSACWERLCSVTPDVVLVTGSHTWFVRASTAAGASKWSAGMRFALNAESNGSPAAVVPVSPSGKTDLLAPAYVWQSVAGAARYTLVVEGPAGVWVRAQYSALDACTGRLCSATPSTKLQAGSYVWSVRAQNSSGFGPSSGLKLGFALELGPKASPRAPTLVAPLGLATDLRPTLQWQALPNVSSYELRVLARDGSQTTYDTPAARHCVNLACRFTPQAPLALGNYYWAVRGMSQGLAGGWSGWGRFRAAVTTSALPAIAAPVSPNAETATSVPEFAWSVAAGAKSYLLWIDGPAGNVFNSWIDAGTSCADGACRFTPAGMWTAGTYSWTVIARNVAGDAAQALPQPFEIEALTPSPATPTPLTPQGLTASATPTIVWSASSGAQFYDLWMEGPSGVVTDARFPADDVCVDSRCSLVSPVVLESGPHALWVRAAGAAGTSAWSAPLGFAIVAGAVAPGACMPDAPTGTTQASSPTYSWDAVAGAFEYNLRITDDEGILFDEWLDAAIACTGPVCALTPSLTLAPGSYTWSVRARNEAGQGPSGATLGFTIEEQE